MNEIITAHPRCYNRSKVSVPSFKRRVINALKATGEAVIDQFILENKFLKVAKATIKGWLQSDNSNNK